VKAQNSREYDSQYVLHIFFTHITGAYVLHILLPMLYVLHIFITQTTGGYVLHIFTAQTTCMLVAFLLHTYTCVYVLHGFIAQATCEYILHIFIGLVKSQATCNMIFVL